MSQSLEWPGAIAAACEQLIHPSVKEGAERQRQYRLACVLFGAPFLAVGALAQLLASQWGAAQALGLGCAVFVASWMPATFLLMTGRGRLVELLSLVFGTAMVAFIIAAAGGLASPLAATAAVLILEAIWVSRSRGALATGVVAAGAAILGGAFLSGPISVPEISAGQWLIPLVYGATLAFRLSGLNAISERRRAGEEAADLADLIESLDAVIVRMSMAGEVLRVSQKAESILNVPGEVLLGTAFFERVHVGDRVAYLCAFSRLREGEGRAQVRVRLRMPPVGEREGLPYFRAFSVEFLSDGDGVVAVVRDDSEKEALESELASARNRSAEARRESRRMIAAASHELRTPLNAILGFSDALLSEIFGRLSDDRQREYVRLIQKAGGHLLSVVNATLDVSAAEAGSHLMQREDFRLDETVATCVALTGSQADARKIAVKIAIPENVGIIRSDRRVVQQVLINLLSNAIKFTPENGRVVVTASRHGERIDFTVEDNGIGMAADDLARIGEPFMRVRNDETRTVEGNGLGLALVKGLVGLQGGGLSIESAPGSGTRVRVTLPIGAEGKAEEAGGEVKQGSGPIMDQEWNDEDYRKTA